MRNLFIILLFVILSANECNLPYRAKIICANNNTDCLKMNLDNGLELSFAYADMGRANDAIWVHIVYNAKAVGTQKEESIDYGSFSLVSSGGIEFFPILKEPGKNGIGSVGYTMRTIQAGQSIDSLFAFSSVKKYAEKEVAEMLKKERFLFLYKHGKTTDTLLTIIADDKRIK